MTNPSSVLMAYLHPFATLAHSNVCVHVPRTARQGAVPVLEVHADKRRHPVGQWQLLVGLLAFPLRSLSAERAALVLALRSASASVDVAAASADAFENESSMVFAVPKRAIERRAQVRDGLAALRTCAGAGGGRTRCRRCATAGRTAQRDAVAAGAARPTVAVAPRGARGSCYPTTKR